MSRQDRVEHEFVEFIPQELAPGTVYISTTYATCAHHCLCGCRNKVITPLSPTDWRLTFDGVSISLDPSVGNWNFDCQSHYVISRGRVNWADAWSRERIDANRARARREKQRYFGERDRGARRDGEAVGAASKRKSWIGKLWRRLKP